MTRFGRNALFAFGAVLIALGSAATPAVWAEAVGPSAESGKSPQASSLDIVFQGLAESMDEAATELRNGRRLQATNALNDSRRVSRLLHDVARGRSKALAKQGLDAVQEGRHALQNGDAARAAEILANGSQSLRSEVAAQRTANTGSQAPAQARSPAKVEGLGVINAKGAELGKLACIVDRNGGQYAVVKVQGVINLFGFVDIANRQVAVPFDQLVLGKGMAVVASDITADQLVASSRFEAGC